MTVKVGYLRGRRAAELWCCVDCYMAQHYGAEFARAEKVDDWDLDTYSENVNSLAECGSELSDWTCPEHNPIENPDTGDLCECVYCGSAEYETGLSEFSKDGCELCGSDRAGRRYRLAVWESAE